MRFPRATARSSKAQFKGKPGTSRDSGHSRTHPTTPSRFTPEALESRQFLSAGTLDTSFGANGKVVDPSLVTAADMAIQADGKIVVSSGRFLARYTTAGQLDPTFG